MSHGEDRNREAKDALDRPRVLRNSTNTLAAEAAGAQRDQAGKNSKMLEKSAGISSEKQMMSNKENAPSLGILGGRRRLNRGYNPKYDSKETEFVCKADAQALLPQPLPCLAQNQSKKPKCESQNA